jgi:hypothetical protein
VRDFFKIHFRKWPQIRRDRHRFGRSIVRYFRHFKVQDLHQTFNGLVQDASRGSIQYNRCQPPPPRAPRLSSPGGGEKGGRHGAHSSQLMPPAAAGAGSINPCRILSIKKGADGAIFNKQRWNIDGIFLPPFLSNQPGTGFVLQTSRKSR